MKYLLLLFPLLMDGQICCGPLVPQTTYYVDGSKGSDSNSGTITAPFASIAKLQASLSSGQTGAIYGGCGSQLIYKEQMTIPAAGVGIVGWGCSQPILDASAAISSCSKTAGFTNIYQTTALTASTLTGFLRMWENNSGYMQAASMSALDSTPGQFFIANNGMLSGNSFTLFFTSSDLSNPCTNGRTYEYNSRQMGLFSAFQNTFASNVQTRRNFSNNGSFEIFQNSFASDITANDGIKHNALMHGGSTYNNFALVNSYYGGMDKIALVVNDDFPTGQNATINNAAYTESFEVVGATGFYAHTNLGGQFGTISCNQCSTAGIPSNGNASVGGFAAAVMVLNGGQFSSGIGIDSPQNFLTNVVAGGPLATLGNIQAVISGVSVSCSCVNGALFVPPNQSPIIEISGSTFSNSTKFGANIYLDTGAAPVLALSNNNFLAPTQVNHICGPGNATIINPSITGNTYHYAVGMSAFTCYHGTFYDISTPTGWANWQALGFDLTGMRVTP